MHGQQNIKILGTCSCQRLNGLQGFGQKEYVTQKFPRALLGIEPTTSHLGPHCPNSTTPHPTWKSNRTRLLSADKMKSSFNSLYIKLFTIQKSENRNAG